MIMIEETWCICNKPEDGWMVECHNEAACDIQWFHFDCVGLATPPKGDWYCSQCKSLLVPNLERAELSNV